MSLTEFEPGMSSHWQSIIDNSAWSPSPLGGPEYAATMNMAWGKTYILKTDKLFIPFVKSSVTNLKILRSDCYQGLRFNSLPGCESISADLLRILPSKCALQLDLPEELYTPCKEILARHNFSEQGNYLYYKVHLPKNYEAWFMQKGMDRSNIRKADKAGIEVKIGGIEMLDDFYRMFLCSFERWQKEDRAKDPHPLERFHRMFEMQSSNAKIACALYDNKVISAVIFCHYKNTAGAFNSGTDFEYQKLRASDYAFSEIIRYLIAQGVKELHLGGTLGGKNLSQFKRKLGASEYKIIYCNPPSFPPFT